MRLRSPEQPSASSSLCFLWDFNLPSPVFMKTLAGYPTPRQETIPKASGSDKEGEWQIDKSLAQERLCWCLHERMWMRRHVRQGSEYSNCILGGLRKQIGVVVVVVVVEGGANCLVQVWAQCSVGAGFGSEALLGTSLIISSDLF